MKKLLLLTLILCLAALSVSAVDFPDMPEDWSAPALKAAVENGLIGGSDGGLLLPEDNLTRAEMATVMVRAFGGSDKADISAFTDVPETEWYYEYMAKAVKMGLFNGDGNKLNPDDAILREEAFAVIARALALSDGDVAVLEKFKDTAEVSDWAKGAVSALVSAKYINGSGEFIQPQQKITRAEFAQVMYNIFGKYISAPGTYNEDIEGSVIISSDGVTLENCTVKGDVIVADGVVIGIALNNISVEGRIVFRGGNANTMTEIYSDRIAMPISGTVVNHDMYGTLIGGKDFSVMKYIRLANPEGFLYEDGKVISPDGPVMKYKDIEISFGLFKYYYRAFLSQVDGGNNEIWKQVKKEMPEDYAAMTKQLKDSVAQTIIQQHIALPVMARENGIVIDTLRKKAADSVAQLEMQYAQYGVSLSELMAEQGITADMLIEMETASLVAAELGTFLYCDDNGEIIVDKKKIGTYIEEKGYMRAQHILVADEATANEVLEKLDNGEDFMALVEQYNTDPGMTEEGYLFCDGEMVVEFETACKQLEPGKISTPVQTTYGYHIIKRLELTDADYSALAADISAAELGEKMASFAKKVGIEVIYSEIFDMAEPANLY